MFRDNAEVHRLQSLGSFYAYHTEIEELCLEKFRNYCDRTLSAIYSNSSAVNDKSLPTPSQVVYFPLLDKWAGEGGCGCDGGYYAYFFSPNPHPQPPQDDKSDRFIFPI